MNQIIQSDIYAWDFKQMKLFKVAYFLRPFDVYTHVVLLPDLETYPIHNYTYFEACLN